MYVLRFKDNYNSYHYVLRIGKFGLPSLTDNISLATQYEDEEADSIMSQCAFVLNKIKI